MQIKNTGKNKKHKPEILIFASENENKSKKVKLMSKSLQSKEISFKGQNIYIGIDVHLKNWSVTLLSETRFLKTMCQDPKAEVLVSHLKKNYPDATYYSAYEAGFCGFAAHRRLQELGVNNIVVNPADVPTSNKERRRKTDAIDSKKIAEALRAKQLEAIHVPSVEQQELRSLIRVRKSIVFDLARMKQRVKSMLYFSGIDFPDKSAKRKSQWTKAFITWLREDVPFMTLRGKEALDALINAVESERSHLLSMNRKIREISRSQEYRDTYNLVTSVPGFGMVSAMTFISEIGDVARFKSSDKLAAFIGLVPDTDSSGDDEVTCGITSRSHNYMRELIIEAAWVAVSLDPSMTLAYENLTRRMKGCNAIIRIARKLVNRLYRVLKFKEPYVPSVV